MESSNITRIVNLEAFDKFYKDNRVKMEAFKIPGLYYFDYADKETSKRSHVSLSPPWTTWSGLMACPLESEHGQRLKKKCGGEVYNNEGKSWVTAFWTAPTDWPEMAAGREDSRPFSPQTYSINEFPFISPNLK